MLTKHKKQNGYITLMMMIIVGSLTAGIVYTVLSDSIGSLQTSLSFNQTYQARSFSNACAERALYRIHNGDITTSETDSITFGTNQTCTYDVSISGVNITINTIGISRRARVEQIVSGTFSGGVITISSWQ